MHMRLSFEIVESHIDSNLPCQKSYEHRMLLANLLLKMKDYLVVVAVPELSLLVSKVSLWKLE